MSNIYGDCTGTSASKYDLWLSVTENSYSVKDNTSTVSLVLAVKRNDSYASSAYNLNQSENSASISVGGAVKASCNLSIDTRDSATVTLCSYTGTFAHGSDGTLTLSVGGSFSMGGSGLSGGSVSGTFKCTALPRASSLSFSASSVVPGGEVTVSVSAASGSFTHKLLLSIGSYSVAYSLAAGEKSLALSIPETWANAVTKAKTGIISAVLTTYCGSTKIGAKNYNLNLTIPNTAEYLPSFSAVLTRGDNTVPAEWGVYVKGKSTLTVDIASESYAYGAAFGAVSVSVGDVMKTAVPSVFELTNEGEITVSVCLSDSRGYSVTKTESITVLPYTPPSVVLKDIYHCTADGTKNEEEAYLAAVFDETFSNVGGNAPVITVQYKTPTDAVFLSAGTANASPFVFGGSFSRAVSYKVMLGITDTLTREETFSSRILSSSAVSFNIRKGGLGAAFGCFAETEKELTVAWDLNLKGMLKYRDITSSITPCSTYLAGTNQNLRFYACMELVLLRAKFDVVSPIPAGAATVVGTITSNVPPVLNVLMANCNGGATILPQAYITCEGLIKIKTNETVPAGSNLYLNGFWFNSDIAEEF